MHYRTIQTVGQQQKLYMVTMLFRSHSPALNSYSPIMSQSNISLAPTSSCNPFFPLTTSIRLRTEQVGGGIRRFRTAAAAAAASTSRNECTTERRPKASEPVLTPNGSFL